MQTLKQIFYQKILHKIVYNKKPIVKIRMYFSREFSLEATV